MSFQAVIVYKHFTVKANESVSLLDLKSHSTQNLLSWDLKDFSSNLLLFKKKYVCSIYKCKTNDINERFQIFCGSAPEERSFPPMKNCLVYYSIWSVQTTKLEFGNLPLQILWIDLVGHGWQMINDKLQVFLWMEGGVTQSDIMKLSYFRCKNTYGSGHCSCVTAGLRCSDLCQCGEGRKNYEYVNNHNNHAASSDCED